MPARGGNKRANKNLPFVYIPEKERAKYRQYTRDIHYRDQKPYMVPRVKYTKGTAGDPTPSASTPDDAVFSGLELYKREHIRNPVIIYGQGYSGKTTMVLRLFDSASSHFGPNHWTRYVEFHQLLDIAKKQETRPKSFLTLLAAQMKTTEEHLSPIFNPPRTKKAKKRSHAGELFLDGFDDIPPNERDYIFKLLKQVRDNCPIRVWIICRSFLKPVLKEAFPEPGSFDLTTYSVREQKEYLCQYWNIEYFPDLEDEKKSQLWEFAEHVYTKLNLMIPGFDDGLGCVPIFLVVVPGIFLKQLNLFFSSGETDPRKIRLSGVCFTELIQKLVISMMECYCYKVSFQTLNTLDTSLIERTCVKILEFNSEYAMKTFPTYEYKVEYEGPGTAICTHGGCTGEFCMFEQLQRFGFVVTEDDGMLRFRHRMVADYFLAKYYESVHSANPGVDFDRFYLQIVLFLKEATNILACYDTYMVTKGPNPSNLAILHDFLIKHYKLGEGEEAEWEKIRDNGNVWHLAVLQGYHQTARAIMNAFSATEKKELRKFLMMRAPLELTDMVSSWRYEPAAPYRDPKKRNLISSLGIVALFGFDEFASDALSVLLQVITPKELQREFNQPGKWSPVHYAACHANIWFLDQIYGTEFQKKVRIQPGILNPGGFTALQLLLTRAWKHVMILKDCNMSDYDDMDIKPPIPSRSHGQDRKVDTSFRLIDRERTMIRNYQEADGLLDTVHLCIEKMVMVGGEDINGFDIQKSVTLLHCAALDGIVETSELLISLGADPNRQNFRGMTPLHIAAWYGCKDVFLYLIKSKANLTIRDRMQRTAVMLWKQWGKRLYSVRGGPPLTRSDIWILTCIEGMDLIANGIRDLNNTAMEGHSKELKKRLNAVLAKARAGAKNSSDADDEAEPTDCNDCDGSQVENNEDGGAEEEVDEEGDGK